MSELKETNELTVTELRQKLENLERSKRELKAEKKRDSKLKSDEIKEVDDEMGDVLRFLAELNGSPLDA